MEVDALDVIGFVLALEDARCHSRNIEDMITNQKVHLLTFSDWLAEREYPSFAQTVAKFATDFATPTRDTRIVMYMTPLYGITPHSCDFFVCNFHRWAAEIGPPRQAVLDVIVPPQWTPPHRQREGGPNTGFYCGLHMLVPREVAATLAQEWLYLRPALVKSMKHHMSRILTTYNV